MRGRRHKEVFLPLRGVKPHHAYCGKPQCGTVAVDAPTQDPGYRDHAEVGHTGSFTRKPQVGQGVRAAVPVPVAPAMPIAMVTVRIAIAAIEPVATQPLSSYQVPASHSRDHRPGRPRQSPLRSLAPGAIRHLRRLRRPPEARPRPPITSVPTATDKATGSKIHIAWLSTSLRIGRHQCARRGWGNGARLRLWINCRG